MMQDSLQRETERLTRSWMRHEAGWLRDYLVGGVEDPRLNMQSVLSRHFVARAVAGERFQALMEQEYRFVAVMNWLVGLAERSSAADEFEMVLHGLRHKADNVEGIEIPGFVLRTFGSLPAIIDGVKIPNYIEEFLRGTRFANGRAELCQPALAAFQEIWNAVLLARRGSPASDARRLSVLEPACGSANDYRFLAAYGLARLVDYAGFDLCAKNIENARALFPGVRFEVGNVFEIAAPDRAFDLCFTHDLFEHLSPEGVRAAVNEICRVVRRGVCVGFFNMDEIPEHAVRTVDEYHWNTLSMARMKELFEKRGFAVRVIHIGAFLRECAGSEQTHNPNAYTFLIEPIGPAWPDVFI